ncbi:cupin domain-containing protein [bacterium]|nr:cupin domain-containing protein [bacterium]
MNENKSELVGRVVDLAGLLDYQNGAVVSNTIIKEKVGTVTLFAFDQGQEFSEHSTPFDALVQIVDGEMEITLSGTPHRVRAGEMLIMPADVPHALTAISKAKMLLVMIRA